MSPGVARGRVRIVEGEHAPLFEKGDVLVARITSPLMLPHLMKAGAVVCEMGGMTSHPSIASREMGIPCVVQVQSARALLREGTLVEVNGTTGEITVLEEDGQ